MATLSENRIAELLRPYVSIGSRTDTRLNEIVPKLSVYLDLLLRWNERTNLTAIREPEEIVQRHFGESVFAAEVIARGSSQAGALLDFGSGAGFPGLPIQICLPNMQVWLSESQGKKAAFLREVVRVLGLKTEIWAGRVEDMPDSRRFEAVTLRAVDNMQSALVLASERVAANGGIVALAGAGFAAPANWSVAEQVQVPAGQARFVYVLRALGDLQ